MKIAIASGKGGTGKTLISTNLAAYISENEKVVLADLDVEEPNAGLFISGEFVEQQQLLSEKPLWDSQKCTLCNECVSICNFNALIKVKNQIIVFHELCHSCFACSELCKHSALPMTEISIGVLKHQKAGNLTFIESRLDVGQEQATPVIAQTIEYLNEKFDATQLVLLDSPPGTACPMIETAKNSDFIFLVTEPTPFGLHDLKLAIATIRELKKEFALIINRDGIGNSELEKHCENENITIAGRLKNSRQIAEIYSQAKLIYNISPEIQEFFDNLKVFIKKLKMT